MSSRFAWRIRAIWILLFLVTVIFLSRLYYLQVMHHEAYLDEADRQYASSAGTVYDRGTIYFSSKEGGLVAAASLKSGYFLAINPSAIKDPRETHDLLSSVISLNKEDFLVRASKSTDRYEEIAHRLSDEAVTALKALSAPWTTVSREKWRFYPGG